MEKLSFQSRAVARSADLLEMCPPKVFRGLRGGEWRVPRSMFETICELDNLGEKPNEAFHDIDD